MPPNKSARSNSVGSPLGFEAKLWLTADKLRNNMDAAECKDDILLLGPDAGIQAIADTFNN